MKQKNDKQRLFEVMGRLDKTFKPQLNEYSNYPAGAEHDPRAPYNQPPDPEFKDWEIHDEGDNLEEYTINFMDDQQGEAYVSLQDILEQFVGSGDAEADATYEYFANAVKSPEMKASEEFKAKLDVAVEKYGELQNWEFDMHYPGPDMEEGKTLTEGTNLQQLNDDMQMIIGDLVSSSSEEEFAAKVNDIAMQYVPEEHVNNPSALDFTKRFILRKFKTDPSVRDAFGNMIQYAENIGGTLNEQGAGGNSEALKKFIYADRLLGDKMTEEQAIQILDDAKSQLGIGDMEIFKANVTAGALYSLLSEYEGEMGGFNQY